MQASARFPIAPLALVLLAGCSYETTIGSEATLIHWGSEVRWMGLYLPALVLGCALWLPFLRKHMWTRITLASLSLFVILVASTMLTEEVKMTDKGIYETYGFPWDRQVRGIPIAELKGIEIYSEWQSSYRSQTSVRRWFLCFGSDEADRSIYPSSLWNVASHSILNHLARFGVRIGPVPNGLDWQADIE